MNVASFLAQVRRLIKTSTHASAGALIAKLNASPSAAELQRISEVLKRATEELRRGKK